MDVEVRLIEESVGEGGACKAATCNIAGLGGVEAMARCSLWVNFSCPR